MTTIRLRHDTAADWTAEDPVLQAGEPGYATDSGTLRIGDGSTPWASLPILVDSTSVQWDVRWSGVVGDGVTDDSAAMRAAKTVCTGANAPVLFIDPTLNVLLNSQVDLTRVRRINAQGTITIGYDAGPGLIVGDTSTQRISLEYYFSRVVWATVQTNVAMRFVGMKDARAVVQYCDYLQLYANSAVSTQTSIAYSDFCLGRILKLELFGEAGISWINENNFYGGSVETLNITGAYGHNCNHWHGTSMESAASTLTIDAVGASCNRFDLRGEAGPTGSFGAGTWGNEVVLHYTSSPGVHSTPMILAQDLGVENIFCTSIDLKMRYREIVRVDAQTVGFNASSEINCPAASVPTPGLNKLMLRSGSGVIIDTGIVPINRLLALNGGTNYYRNFSLVRLNFESDVTLWRPTVYAFDSTGAAIDPTITPWMQTTGGWVANAGGYYAFGANVQFAQMTIISTTVASIRITVAPASSIGTAFQFAKIMAYVQTPQPDTAIEKLRQGARRPLYQTTIPTQGAAQLGTMVAGPSQVWRATARADTTLTATAAAAATSLTVASISGISSGDVIGVLQDDGTTFWTTVNGAPSGSTVTLTAGLTSQATSGNAVVTNTWATSTTPLGCPSNWWIPTGTAYSTSAAFTNGVEMATPIWVPRAGILSAIGMEFTAASTEATTPAVRLGVRADDGNGRPGALLVDGGTVSVASGTTPGQVSVVVSVPVTPGWYHATGTIQGVSAAYPTLRVNSTGIPVPLSSMAVSTSVNKFGYTATGVTGALPGTYTVSGPTNLTPKLMLQLT